MNKIRLAVLYALSLVLLMINSAAITENPNKSRIIVLNEDSSWCWFQDNRVVIDGDKLLFTGVTSKGANTVSSVNMVTGQKEIAVINDSDFKADDHNVGVLFLRPDGRYLNVYAGHGVESKMRYRISSDARDIKQWDKEKTVETGAGTTYSNVYRLSETGKTYNFHRGIGRNPNYMVSDDDGSTWRYGGRLFAFKGRPYVRYASNNIDQIHFITTEEHPRHYNNSIYYGYIKNDKLYKSGGKFVSQLSKDENTDVSPQDFTLVYDGDSTTRENVAWTSDIKLDKRGYPYIAFSVTKDPIKLGETKDTEFGGFDNRYHYARWDGSKWLEYEIAYAGSRLYAGENEYTGLITLHPDDPDIVYISTNVDPKTGREIRNNRKYEIYRGVTHDQGKNWDWIAITENSDEDNIRPIVVSSDNYEALLWLNGTYTTYENYSLKVLGLIQEK